MGCAVKNRSLPCRHNLLLLLVPEEAMRERVGVGVPGAGSFSIHLAEMKKVRYSIRY
jgi:hypothetical protein